MFGFGHCLSGEQVSLAWYLLIGTKVAIGCSSGLLGIAYLGLGQGTVANARFSCVGILSFFCAEKRIFWDFLRIPTESSNALSLLFA